MKYGIKFFFLLASINTFSKESIDTFSQSPCMTVSLTHEEIDIILSESERYVYFGPEVCTLIQDLASISIQPESPLYGTHLHELCSIIAKGYKIAPIGLVDVALCQAAEYLSGNESYDRPEETALLLERLDTYYNHMENGSFNLIISDVNNDNIMMKCGRKCKSFCSLKVCATTTNYLMVDPDPTIGGSLTISGNHIIGGNATIQGAINATIEPDFISPVEIIGAPEQSCILFEDNTLTEKARLCSSAIVGDKGIFISVNSGATANLRVTHEGGAVIAAPTSGTALSVMGNNNSSAIVATGNGTALAPALTLAGNSESLLGDDVLTIDSSGVVRQSTLSPDSFIANGCQSGPLAIGTNDTTALSFATNGCTPRVTIDSEGAVAVLTPTAGEALTVNGNIVVPSATAVESEGILKLGGTGSTNISVYEIGTRNFFVGNGAVNALVTGTDNVAIGTTTNSSLTAGNNVIAIGTAAQATASDSIAMGNASVASAGQTIALGSTDSTSTGLSAQATASNAIAIGSASSSSAGANAGGISTIAIGGADGATFAGATASGVSRSIAIGVAALAQSDGSILVGSASGTAGGFGPNTTERAAICIGSAINAFRGANSRNVSTIAIGSSDGTSIGPVAFGTRSIAIGHNALMTANTATGTIVIGGGSSAGAAGPSGGAVGGGVVIGSAQAAFAGAAITGAGGVAIGGSSGNSQGATTTAARAVALGAEATCTTADGIVLGNAAATAVRVGIGTSTPAAKLDIVGANGTPVIRVNQVNTAAINAPRWLNRTTSAAGATPIHYNGSNQLFGFTSSKRYKQNIRPLLSESQLLYQLRPVMYDAKAGDGQNIIGFIAEEVHEVAPELAIMNSDGQPENVAYNSLHALVIKELQHHQNMLNHHANLLKDNAMLLDMLMQKTYTLQQQLHTYISGN